jgi:hypothetical protein
LHDFRGLWVETQKRRQLIDHLLGEHYSPDTVRELVGLAKCDHFDLFAHYGYREKAPPPNARYCKQLNLPAPQPDLLTITQRLQRLTPGDFAAVLRQHRFRPIQSPVTLVSALEAECAVKEGGKGSIGFL